jgi:hypothetical protein
LEESIVFDFFSRGGADMSIENNDGLKAKDCAREIDMLILFDCIMRCVTSVWLQFESFNFT